MKEDIGDESKGKRVLEMRGEIYERDAMLRV